MGFHQYQLPMDFLGLPVLVRECMSLHTRGKATEELSRRVVKELRASAAKVNIALSDETRICRFDPPFKPGFLQYNEIVIPVFI